MADVLLERAALFNSSASHLVGCLCQRGKHFCCRSVGHVEGDDRPSSWGSGGDEWRGEVLEPWLERRK